MGFSLLSPGLYQLKPHPWREMNPNQRAGVCAESTRNFRVLFYCEKS